MTRTREPQPIVDILSRVAVELTDLAGSVERLHSLVETIDHNCAVQRSAYFHTAQSIDIAEQRLASLSHFITELVELIPPDWEILGHAAARNLKLTALATRLSNKEALELVATHAAGESEFF
jgi:hypothetical protein